MAKAFNKAGVHKGHDDCANDRHGPVRFVPKEREDDDDPNADISDDQYGFCLSCGERVIRQFAYDEDQAFLFEAKRAMTWSPWSSCNWPDVVDEHWWANRAHEDPVERLGYLDDAP